MATGILSVTRLRELLVYDPLTGHFTWRERRGNAKQAGSIAGSVNSDGYVTIRVDRRPYLAHRLAWLYQTGEWPEGLIDHKNRVKTENWFLNLRVVDHSLNGQNRVTVNKNNTSGALGVRVYKGRFFARIVIDRKQINLGGYSSLEMAAQAYRDAKHTIHKEAYR
jgi:hypothetical protein